MMRRAEQQLLDELDRLIELGQQVVSGGHKHQYGYHYDDELAFRWKTSATGFLARVFGETSNYCKSFSRVFANFNSVYGENLKRAQGVLLGAKDDIASGALGTLKSLVQAEIFSDLLEQAEYLQQNGYALATAVITGAVLEDGLRKICDLKGIELSQRATLEPMNVALAKTGVYSGLVQKQITALADLRNKAAHGKSDDFTDNDVEVMVKQARDLLTRYLA